ncbi:unnamed protein product [Mytilus coruscus]|uniref:Reverse transcriptase domain-containing protein n=1 Tax=Mytilus coruscus TaxID=42192 RepID=A0A6J8BJJ6_MYTCO|nr:unnamed protein product [Mytilus coruscus]
MGTYCEPLLADLFLYSYEADLNQNLLKDKKRKHISIFFSFTFRYIDDVLSLNKPYFSQYLNLVFPSELEMKDTTDTRRTASYLDLFLHIDTDGRLHIKIYDERDDFNTSIINFSFLASNITLSHRIWCLHLSGYVMLVHVHTILTSYTGNCRNCSNRVMRRKD